MTPLNSTHDFAQEKGHHFFRENKEAPYALGKQQQLLQQLHNAGDSPAANWPPAQSVTNEL